MKAMKTATLINTSINQVGAKWKHYKLSKPIDYENLDNDEGGKTSYVIISQVLSAFAQETFVFPADEDGECINFLDLPGSSGSPISHEEVLENMGYTIAEKKNCSANEPPSQ